MNKKRFLAISVLPFALCGCKDNKPVEEVEVDDFHDKVIQMEQVDSSYKTNEATNKGSIVTETYTFNNIKKRMQIYLPYNYDSGEEYDTFYLMHGTNGTDMSYIEDIQINNVLDNLIEANEIKPIIVVMPTWFGANLLPNQVFSSFPYELEYLVSHIEETYKTYSGANKRDHRLVGGFSLGGITTWSTLVRKFDLFRNYLSMSGYLWENSANSSAAVQKKNVNTLYDAISASTYKDEYLIYNYYGGINDLVHDSSYAQVEAMYKSEKFNFDNIVVKECSSVGHSGEISDTYIIDALRNIFPNK